MGRTHGLVDLLEVGDMRYIVVMPHRGLTDDWDVVNAWNKKTMRTFGEKDEAVAWATEKAVHSRSFDYVLELHEPKLPDDEEE